MGTSGHTPSTAGVPALEVRTPDGRRFSFSRPFLIGRDLACDVQIDDGRVSRRHALVAFEHGRWQVHDQQSGNGLLVDGRRVQTATVDPSLSIRLGSDGPVVALAVAPPPDRPAPAIPDEEYLRKLQGKGPVGSKTMMFRVALKKQRRTYRVIVAALAVLAVVAAVMAYLNHRRLAEQQAAAQEIFYLMKEQEVAIALLEQKLFAGNVAVPASVVEDYKRKKREAERRYDEYLARLNVGRRLSDKEQLILRVTRRLGESEVGAPPEYLSEVSVYISRWQRTGRFAAAVKRARDLGYTPKIVAEFDRFDLPRQFFYLAMQESDFVETAVGPPTRFGFAKGMWMFIPETGRRYGLSVGPLERFPRSDPQDDRHHWEKATRGAALYIKDLYATKAQASGLLVMASYNWGENRVLRLIERMPQDPRQRNFWNVLARYRDQVPKQTYDYVFSIVAAAVIGENPRLFGFPFDNPLEEKGAG